MSQLDSNSVRNRRRRRGCDLTISGTSFKVDGRARFFVFISYFDALHQSASNLTSDFAYLRTRESIGAHPANWWRYSGEYPGPDGFFYAQDTLIAPDTEERSADEVAEGAQSGEATGSHRGSQLQRGVGGVLPRGQLPRRRRPYRRLLAQSGPAPQRTRGSGDGSQPCRLGVQACVLQHPERIRQAVERATRQTPAGRLPVGRPEHRAGRPCGRPAHHRHGFDEVGDSSTTAAKRFAGNAWLARLRGTRGGILPGGTTPSRWVTELRAQGLPVYLQEPAPSDHSSWTPGGIRASLLSAYNSGAAAWCFHTRRSFHLSDKAFGFTCCLRTQTSSTL